MVGPWVQLHVRNILMCRSTRRAAAIPPVYPVCFTQGWGDGDFSPFPSQWPMNSKAIQRNLSHLMCLQQRIWLPGFLRSRNSLCSYVWVLLLYLYMLANIDLYIWLLCRAIRNQAESSYFSLDLLYSFLLTPCPLLASSHSLSSNYIW